MFVVSLPPVLYSITFYLVRCAVVQYWTRQCLFEQGSEFSRVYIGGVPSFRQMIYANIQLIRGTSFPSLTKLDGQGCGIVLVFLSDGRRRSYLQRLVLTLLTCTYSRTVSR